MRTFTFTIAAFLIGSTSLLAQNGNVGIGTTTPATKLDINGSFRTQPLSPNTNGNSGAIPLTTSAFFVADGNHTTPLTLAANPAAGQRLVIYSQASFNTLINTANTSLNTAINMRTGEAYEFIGNGSSWALVKNASAKSAVRATGNITLAVNNTAYFNDATAAPTEVFDDLDEFSGHTFTPIMPGLYQVTFTANFQQRASSNDGGDGYLGFARIRAGVPAGSPATAPVYNTAIVKVTLPEAGGGPSSNSINNTQLVKLAAGEVIQLDFTTFGQTNGVTASYTINIVRVD